GGDADELGRVLKALVQSLVSARWAGLAGPASAAFLGCGTEQAEAVDALAEQLGSASAVLGRLSRELGGGRQGGRGGPGPGAGPRAARRARGSPGSAASGGGQGGRPGRSPAGHAPRACRSTRSPTGCSR